MKPYMELGSDAESRANTAALLLTAVIAAHGGYHLLLGENQGVLTQGYYVDYSSLTDEFFREIRTYYDFIIRYATVFFDSELRDVSMTHVDGDNLEYVFGNGAYSTYGEAGRIWSIVKEKPSLKVIHLINLIGVSDDYWNQRKERPTEASDLIIHIQVDDEVESVFLASPDSDMGRPYMPQFQMEAGPRGKTLVVFIPRLKVWSIVVVNVVNAADSQKYAPLL
ncbi:Cycloisomaltooligosaccharide glucanotransferase precursor [compost metagenome]